MEEHEREGRSDVVARAIAIAGDAVAADEHGDMSEAVGLYQRSVDLISYGLSLQAEDEDEEEVAQLLEFSEAYAERVRHQIQCAVRMRV